MQDAKSRRMRDRAHGCAPGLQRGSGDDTLANATNRATPQCLRRQRLDQWFTE